MGVVRCTVVALIRWDEPIILVYMDLQLLVRTPVHVGIIHDQVTSRSTVPNSGGPYWARLRIRQAQASTGLGDIRQMVLSHPTNLNEVLHQQNVHFLWSSFGDSHRQSSANQPIWHSVSQLPRL